MPKKENQSFWTSLPGILTGLAGLLTAMGALLAALRPPSPPPDPSPHVFNLAEFKQKTIVERATYNIRHEGRALTLAAVNVRAKKRELKLEFGIAGQSPTVLTLAERKPGVAVLAGREFVLEVHGFTDLKDGMDQASISVMAR